jgi:hypothetical protein
MLEIRQAGQYVPKSAIFELKTRSIKKKETDVLGEQIARLWVTQIPNFVLAFHRLGVFEEIQVHDVQKEVRKWEEDNQTVVHQFATLLETLASFARSCEGGKLELRREEGSSTLELRTQANDAGCVLPDDLKERWISVSGEPWGRRADQPSWPRDTEDGEPAGLDWDDEEEKDFTACSADSCGYCGHCSY